MASSTAKEIEQALLAAINESNELFEELEKVPEQIMRTVIEFAPVGNPAVDPESGLTVADIDVSARRTKLKKLSYRKAKLGEVYSEDDPARVNSIEYGRAATDKHGGTPEHAMFRRAADLWNDVEI
jgi:hypothetical protein